jgi:hypothetical protein
MRTLWALLLITGTATAQNFTGPEKYTARAEELRRELAVWWQGHPMPQWSDPCPITVREHTNPNISGGGATSFAFSSDGEVYGWRMSVSGREQDLLDNTLPHEVNHTVLASLLRRPSPRWLSEGLCQLFEGPDEHKRHRTDARRFQEHPWCAWRRLDYTGPYPQTSDGLQALYGTGFSVVEWLLETGGRRQLQAFTTDGAPVSQRFRTHYNKTATQAEREWRAWVQTRPVECSACDCRINGNQRRQYVAKPPADVGTKPRLVAVGSPWCLACLPFSNDWGLNQGFRMDLSSRVDVTKIDGSKCHDWCRKHAVESYPAFVVLWPDGTHTTWHGYTGKRELLSHLDNLRESYYEKNPQQAPPPPKLEDEPPRPTVDLAAVRTAATEAAQAAIKAALDKAQAQADAAADAAAQAAQAQADAEAAQAQAQAATEAAQAQAQAQAQAATEAAQAAAQADAAEVQPPPKADPEPAAGLPWGTIAISAATAAGVGVPGWALYALYGLRGARRLRRRRRHLKRQAAEVERTVVVDAPPAKEKHRIDTRFVTVEADSYQKAHELARAEIGRRYPGSLDILEAEISLLRQFLAGDKQQQET